MSRSISGVEESIQSKGIKITTGIHEVKVKTVEVIDVPGKDGKPDWKKGNVTFECTKTIQGKDSVGKTIDYQITLPLEWDKVEAGSNGKNTLTNGEKLGKRLIHLFNKISTSDKKDTVTKAIQKLNFDTIDALISGLDKIIKGRSIRLKIVGDKNRQWPIVPLYYSGYAECLDVNPTELTYDENTESTISQPKNAEVPSDTSTSLAGNDTDELPF